MLKRLAANTFVTAGSFFVTGLAPLLLVPIFLKTYGATEYGLLVLVRLLLPSGVLAICDLGKTENASYAVTRALHDGDWSRCMRYLGGLLLIAAGVGIPAAALLALLMPVLVSVFDVPPSSREGFEHVILANSVCFPVLLGALVSDGVLRGFEQYKRLRTVEVLSTFLYAVVALGCVQVGLPYQWVAYTFLGYGVVRALMSAALAVTKLREHPVRVELPQPAEWVDLRKRCMPLGLNRTIGVAQAHAAPVLIGAILGAAAVALYDIVVRIPRFLKIVTGLMNTAVLPAVMRLDAAGDHAQIRRLLEMGLLGVLCIAAPVVAWSMCFSEAILRLWVSHQYAGLWPWQTLMFMWPLVNALTSFSCGALLGRPRFVATLNWIVFSQIIVQLGVSLGMVWRLGEQSFVAGQILALCASLPFQLWLVGRETKLKLSSFGRHFACVAIFAVLAAAGIALQTPHRVHSAAELGASLVLWGAVSAGIVWALILSPQERYALSSSLLRRLRRTR